MYIINDMTIMTTYMYSNVALHYDSITTSCARHVIRSVCS